MAWQGEKHSLLGGAFHKEMPYSLHSSQGQHPHQAMQRSQFSFWQVRRSRNGCNFTRFVCFLCAAWPKSKDAGQKITTARNYGGAFFTLNCSYKSIAGKLTLGGWRRKENLNTTDCCHWIWLCSKVCWSWDWLGYIVSWKQSVPSADYKAILIVLPPPWQPYPQPQPPGGEMGCWRTVQCLQTMSDDDEGIQTDTTLLQHQKGPNSEKEIKPIL